IRQFVNVIDKIDLCFNLGEGRRVVDAKSILGVMALDLTRPVPLSYDSDDETIKEKLAPFIY
ncbi:MAG: HPr family phosphocarrier protein, partial [Eubacterium sp.]|nr:HPr family phosphocarrier protein [Eubacterium sp.]